MFEVFSASSNTSLQSLWEVFHSLVDRSIWQIAPDKLKHFLQFGDCFQLCFKPAVSLHIAPHARHSTGFISGEFGAHWSLVKKSGHLACSQFVRDPHMLMAQYLDNGWRYGLGANEAPMGNCYLGIKWSRNRWRHVTVKGQGRDPNMLRVRYLVNS